MTRMSPERPFCVSSRFSDLRSRCSTCVHAPLHPQPSRLIDVQKKRTQACQIAACAPAGAIRAGTAAPWPPGCTSGARLGRSTTACQCPCPRAGSSSRCCRRRSILAPARASAAACARPWCHVCALYAQARRSRTRHRVRRSGATHHGNVRAAVLFEKARADVLNDVGVRQLAHNVDLVQKELIVLHSPTTCTITQWPRPHPRRGERWRDAVLRCPSPAALTQPAMHAHQRPASLLRWPRCKRSNVSTLPSP